MVKTYLRGARAAKAGDDFHELWVLRQALGLLEADSKLTAVTVEGLKAEDENGTPQDTWDGVDCTLYFNGDNADSAQRIEIIQLKYSTANPDKMWTVARLTTSTNRKQDNSVIGRLARAFAGLSKKRPDLAKSSGLRVRFISNQPIDPAVLSFLKGHRKTDQTNYNKLRLASSLPDKDFKTFINALDLGDSEEISRLGIEERILATISELTDEDARADLNLLMRFIRRCMMPEAKRDFITRQSILCQFGFSDPCALFPCPSAVKHIEHIIQRETCRLITEQMLHGKQRICLHGEACCGKTTAIQEIEALLPQGSVVVVFDCYGGGRYLDSDAFRHRPSDAFLHLSNDLARILRIPIFIGKSQNCDYPRVFKKRLKWASEVLAASTPNALLVVIIDAADNSIIAANSQSPPERSFIHDFISIGDLPPNIRFLLTTRTGRLSSLELPNSFCLQEITEFTRDESAAHVRAFWSKAPDSWIDDFHYFSHGNPRVQQYALDKAGIDPARALDYLRPTGKNPSQIFNDLFEHARRKVGRDYDIKILCAGLVALPRPVPISDLSAVTRLDVKHIQDLCADLAPGLRQIKDEISFSDEDFEDFVRQEAISSIDQIRTNIADHFLERHKLEGYAATHLASALFAADRGKELLDLIRREGEPLAIIDPLLRREVQLQRLRIAMKVCRDAGNNVDAVITILCGAEASKTKATIQNILVKNPDIAAIFAHDTACRIVLRDPALVENHGPLLFHLMAADAQNGDFISVREGQRQVQAWLERRNQYFEEQKKQYPQIGPQGWTIDENDIAAEIEAILRSAGPQCAMDRLRKWRPETVAPQVISILSHKLIIGGEEALLEQCIAGDGIPIPWILFILTPLALSGKAMDLSILESCLKRLRRHRLIRLDDLRNNRRNANSDEDILETILTACEVFIARNGNPKSVIPTLEQFADREFRRWDKLHISQVSLIDFTLRAFTVLECLAGRKVTFESYLTNPIDSPKGTLKKENEDLRRADEKKKELKDFIEPFVDFYIVRARTLMSAMKPGEVADQLHTAINRYQKCDDYHMRSGTFLDALTMRSKIAQSISALIGSPGLDGNVVFECISAILDSPPVFFGFAQAPVFKRFALQSSLHKVILDMISARAKDVRKLKESAEDKIDSMLGFIRLLLPISQADAESLFNEVLEVAGELNTNAIHELSFFEPLAKRAVGHMNVQNRREVARDLLLIIGDAAIRLSGYDNFPWEKVARALATLDVCLALAATGRWEDSNIVGRATLLPSILGTALAQRDMTSVQVAALLSFLDSLEVEMLEHLVKAATTDNHSCCLRSIINDLAQAELLRFGHGTRQEVNSILNNLPKGEVQGYWFDQLMQAGEFHEARKCARTEPALPLKPSVRSDSIEKPGWNSHRFITPEEIQNVVSRMIAIEKESKSFFSASAIFDQIGSAVDLSDRVSHLEALSLFKSQDVFDYELAKAISQRVEEWSGTPAIDRWCQNRLLAVVMDLLPGFSQFIVFGQSPLPTVLEKTGQSDYQICAALLEAIERHVEALDSPTIYALLGLIGRYCEPSDAAQIIEQYSSRLLQRIPDHERDQWNLGDIPTEVSDGIARLLYAFMGDVDVRNRWRAGHALRSLARLGDVDILERLISFFDRMSELSFRGPDAPFYWLAARLWLIITIHRITAETPSAVKSHGLWLLGIAKDECFPHILVRAFAKSAVSELEKNGSLVLDNDQRKMLKRANTSPVHRKRDRRLNVIRFGFDRYGYHECQDRRFSFDSIDTLPYWYTNTIDVFADITGEEFLTAAERWIVDQWGVKNNPWRWDDEPRRDSLSDRDCSLRHHSHGSRPTIELYHTYLEWHAMWCATGELMWSRALAKASKNDYHHFEHLLERNGLSEPPLWLADLHSPKPLEDQFWFPPHKDVNQWMEGVSDKEFLAELGVIPDNEWVVAGSYHDTRSCDFASCISVHTALVKPETAGALVRALQTVTDSWDYKLPTDGEDLEIDTPPYKLKGWLVEDNNDSGIDAIDPLRYKVSRIECRPSSKTRNALNITFTFDDQAKWINKKYGNVVFVYRAWGDIRNDQREEMLRFDKVVHSTGWRLLIDKGSLRAFLVEMGLDLIADIEITRRSKGYDFPRYNEEEPKESRFDKVILLRRDGTIEAAEGCLGTWAASRTRIRIRR